MHFGIVGGGISGLSAALLLRRDGHRVTVFEASDRLGGRIRTHRFSSTNDEHAYFEAGAMRIPRSKLHQPVFDLIRYINIHSATEDKIELIPYVLETENNTAFFRGKRADIESPDWAAHLGLPSRFHGKSARVLLKEVVSPWLALLRKDFSSGFEELLRYDEFSFRAYLRAVERWPHEVIEFVELFMSQTNQYDLSFTDLIMQNLDFDTKEWVTVAGGMSRMTDAAGKLVGQSNIRVNAPVREIEKVPDGRIRLAVGTDTEWETFDKVLLAIPPAALHSIRRRPLWGFMKEQAIRGTHFEPLYKIGLLFRTRFWEQLEKPCFGGQSATDLRFRWIVYPSNGRGSSGHGVLLLYCWMTDAVRMVALPPAERVAVCLDDLETYFASTNPPINVKTEFVEAADVAWTSEAATGDAMFLPGQFSRFFEQARQMEDGVAFAGEHLSKHHTWITGAVQSAHEAVSQMLGAEAIHLTPLGREFTGSRLNRRQKAYSQARFIVPSHMNVEYVDATKRSRAVRGSYGLF